MWLVQPDEEVTACEVTPLEIAADAIGARTIFEDDLDIARRLFDELHAAGYRIAVARKQWR